MPQVKIIESRKFPSQREGRVGRMDTLIVYTVDGQRDQTFAAIIHSDTPTDGEITAAIRTDQEQRKTQLGKTLTI